MRPEPGLPDSEVIFSTLLEEWHVAQGVSPAWPLLPFVVRADGPQTYRAGQRVSREVATLVDLTGRRVLDVGCGFGGALVGLSRAGATCVGIEHSASRLPLCRRRLELHGAEASLARADAFALPFADGAFDVVVCMEVLEHVRQRPAMIKEMCRVLQPSGVLYLSFPNLLSLESLLSDPHYQLAGVIALPPALARWYTRLRRRCDYDVEVLPAAPWIAWLCRRQGVEVFSLDSSERVLLERIRSPETISRPIARMVFGALRSLGLSGLLRAAVRVRSWFGGATLMGQKAPSTPRTS